MTFVLAAKIMNATTTTKKSTKNIRQCCFGIDWTLIKWNSNDWLLFMHLYVIRVCRFRNKFMHFNWWLLLKWTSTIHTLIKIDLFRTDCWSLNLYPFHHRWLFKSNSCAIIFFSFLWNIHNNTMYINSKSYFILSKRQSRKNCFEPFGWYLNRHFKYIQYDSFCSAFSS